MSEHAQQIDRPYLDFDGERAKTLPPLPLRSAVANVPIPARGADTNEVLRCVAQAYLLSVGSIIGRDKFKNIAEARLVTYWLLRSLCNLSYPEIGKVLKKDHTSAISGVKKCIALRERDPSFKAFTDELTEAVRARLKGAAAA
jgi:chromosomal replication initiation ATPase DnaA